MKISVTPFQKKLKIELELGEKIAEGSNSYIYNAKINPSAKTVLVCKISKSNTNYVSFNLQYHSFLAALILQREDIIVPKIYLYGYSDEIGDVLLMQKIENIYDLEFIIQHSLYPGELVVRQAAKAIASLHNLGISGYDLEFYWKADTNQLAILDIGPRFTFDIAAYEMLERHWDLEKDNIMGQWNILSQIIPIEKAKALFSSPEQFDKREVRQYLDPGTVKTHIENVAGIHALSLISKTTVFNREQYLRIFLGEYKKTIRQNSLDSATYLRAFTRTISKKEQFAEAHLYYSLAETLCKESCAVKLER